MPTFSKKSNSVKRKINFSSWSPESKKFLRDVQIEQKSITYQNPAENWFAKKIKKDFDVGHFSRQKKMGYRIFDFWCKKLRCAIEIDGKLHDKEFDERRDHEYRRKFKVRIFRIKAFSNKDYELVLEHLKRLSTLRAYEPYPENQLLAQPHISTVGNRKKNKLQGKNNKSFKRLKKLNKNPKNSGSFFHHFFRYDAKPGEVKIFTKEEISKINVKD